MRTRFHRAVQCLKKIVKERQIRESDLRMWSQAHQLVLEDEWYVSRNFYLRDYIILYEPLCLEGLLESVA